MIFASTMIYGLAKQFGSTRANEVFREQLSEPTRKSLPVVRTIARLRHLEDVTTFVDPSSSTIGRARSRAFHAARQNDADVWVSCDDDVEANLQTLSWLLEAVRSSGGIAMAPYWIRGEKSPVCAVTLMHDEDRTMGMRVLASGAQLIPASRGGFGLVAVARAAIEALVAAYGGPERDMWFVDDDGTQMLGIFHEILAGGKWWSEDLSFFIRVPSEITVEALVSGTTSHAGQILQLSDLLLNVTPPEEESPDDAPSPTEIDHV